MFLFHVFFAAANRMTILAVWPECPVIILFAAGLVVGVGGPLLLHDVLLRDRWTALLFLGIELRRPGAGSRSSSGELHVRAS